MEGDKESELMAGGWTVRVAEFVVIPKVPVIVTEVEDGTGVVAMVTVADVAPAGTITDDGMLALELLDVKPTTMPPVGARPDIFTVQTDVAPPITLDGDTVTDDRVGARMVRLAVC